MSGFPTKKELEQMIADGKKCMRCNKRPATIVHFMGCWAIADCEECKAKAKEESAKTPMSGGKHYNPDRVYSVHTINGKQVPFNEGGNPINPVHAKYERASWEKPRF